MSQNQLSVSDLETAKFKLSQCLHELLAAAVQERAIDGVVAEIIGEVLSVEFGTHDRKMKFICSNETEVTFVQSDDLKRLTFEIKFGETLIRKTIDGRLYNGVTHLQIFATYFDNDVETAQMNKDFRTLETERPDARTETHL